MSGAGGRYDISTLKRGADFVLTVTVNQIGSNSPLPLTGYTVKAKGATRWDATDASSVLWDCDNGAKGGITIPTPTNGQVVLTLTHTQTAAIARDSGVWDMILVAPSGAVTPLLWGLVEVDRRLAA